jgi:hypothetical protein
MKERIKKIKPHIEKMKPRVKKLKPKKPTRLWYVDNLSSIAFGNALAASLEKYVYGLSPSESLDARVFSTTFGLLFVNKLYAVTRDKSREMFNVDLSTSSSKKITLHDSLVCGAFTTAYCFGMYEIVADGKSMNENFTNALSAGALYGALGAVVSYNMDSFRDFLGVSENPKLPKRIRELNKTKKQTVAAGVLAVYAGIFSSKYVDYANDKYDSYMKTSPDSNFIEFQDVSGRKSNLEKIIIDDKLKISEI